MYRTSHYTKKEWEYLQEFSKLGVILFEIGYLVVHPNVIDTIDGIVLEQVGLVHENLANSFLNDEAPRPLQLFKFLLVVI